MASSETLPVSERMARIVEGLPTNAAKIRALYREGYERAAIRRFLGIRYQQVQNVIKRSKLDEPAPGGGAAAAWAWAKIGPAGRVTIPRQHLEALGLQEGDDVQLELADQELRIVPKDVAIGRVQALARRYVPEGVSLVDELIAERRREAAAEGEEGD